MRRFQPPPGIELEPARGTLLVGRRGSGKTMLLRHLEQTYDGLAVYGDLTTILNPISTDTGTAGLTFDVIRPSEEISIRHKTTCLLAFWFASECAQRGIKVSAKVLDWALPKRLRGIGLERKDPRDVLFGELAWAELDTFGRGPDIGALRNVISAASNDPSLPGSRPIMILLDRAERVPYPCLDSVLMLLDQTDVFTSVVATRPGVMGSDQSLSADSPAPGDHYHISHLGSFPYSKQWYDFQVSALRSWVPHSLSQIPSPELVLLLRISRDSLRCALELVHTSIGDAGTFEWQRALECVAAKRAVLLQSIQGQLRHLKPNITAMLNDIRSSHGDDFRLPVKITLDSEETDQEPEQLSLFHIGRALRDMSRDEQFVQLALRAGLLTTLHGDVWHPFASIEAAEVFPLFLWEEGDRWSTI